MKDYFIRLFEYDKYANELLYESMITAGQPEKAVQLMAHLLASQQIWLKRCQRSPTQGVDLWPDWKADLFPAIITNNHKDWINLLQQLTDQDFTALVNYKNSKGYEYTNTLSDILTHLINHGTHHRAQAGQCLKVAGLNKLPVTDYIFYIRDRKSAL